MRFLPIFIFFASSVPALSQEDCGGVLANGTYQSEKVDANFYSRQVALATYSKMTATDVKNSLGHDGKVGYGNLAIQGDWKKDKIENAQAEIRSSLDVDRLLKNQQHFLSLSGDPVIVKAWLECMKTKGGVFAALEPMDNEKLIAKLKISYFITSAAPNLIPLIEHVETNPGVMFVAEDAAPRIAVGKNLVRQASISSLVSRTSADIPLIILVTVGGFGTVEAWLPAIAPNIPIKPVVQNPRICIRAKAKNNSTSLWRPTGKECATRQISSDGLFMGDDTGWNHQRLQIYTVTDRVCFRHHRTGNKGLVSSGWVCAKPGQISPYAEIGDDTGYKDQRIQVRWDGDENFCMGFTHFSNSKKLQIDRGIVCSKDGQASKWLLLGDDTGYSDQRLMVEFR